MLLMDELLCNLDARLRQDVREPLQRPMEVGQTYHVLRQLESVALRGKPLTSRSSLVLAMVAVEAVEPDIAENVQNAYEIASLVSFEARPRYSRAGLATIQSGGTGCGTNSGAPFQI
jgi:hypothetical protein